MSKRLSRRKKKHLIKLYGGSPFYWPKQEWRNLWNTYCDYNEFEGY